MTKTNHGEPWIIRKEFGLYEIVNASGEIIYWECRDPDEEGYERQEPRIDRIVACVNGCAGIDPSSVPMTLQGLKLALSQLSFEDTTAEGIQIREQLRAIISQAESAEPIGTTLASKPPQNK